MAIRITLRELLQTRGIVERQFALQSGIREGTFYQICNNEIKHLPVEAIDAICTTLGVTVDEWIKWTPNE